MVRLGVIVSLVVVLSGCDALLKPETAPATAGIDTSKARVAELSEQLQSLEAKLQAEGKACREDAERAAAALQASAQQCDAGQGELSTGMGLIGQVEYADILPLGVRQKARIDTGAETTSVGAVNIEVFERDARKWVQFGIALRDSDKVIDFKKPLVRTASIKRHNADNVQRPVVELKIAIGDLVQTVEVTLADRSAFEFPVLIGRNFLDGRAVVDVSQKFLALE